MSKQDRLLHEPCEYGCTNPQCEDLDHWKDRADYFHEVSKNQMARAEAAEQALERGDELLRQARYFYVRSEAEAKHILEEIGAFLDEPREPAMNNPTPPQDKAPRESCERCGGFPRGDWAAHKPMCSIGRDLRKPTTPRRTTR